MNNTTAGGLHIPANTKPEDPHFTPSRSGSMHIPASMPASREWDYHNAHSLQPLKLQNDGHGIAVVENGNGSVGNSQSSEGSKHSPSALGSGSQTSMTTVEGTQSLVGNGNGVARPGLGNEAKMDGQWIGADLLGSNGLLDVSAMGSRPRVGSLSGQKRNAAGDIKASPEAESGLNTAWGRHSKGSGSPSRGSKIAELSVHLRSRLSYAAARVEKDWQRDGTQIPLRLRQSGSPTPTAPTKPVLESRSQNRTPESTTLEASNHYSNDAQMSPARSDILPSNHASQLLSATSPTKSLHTPKLAPPVDIISSGSGRRRRPNPNDPMDSRYAPCSSHRRYHSQQEFGTSKLPGSSNMNLVPETPPLRPSIHTASPSTHGYSRARTQSQSTLMEQDAIETLLFMSSPENSGYRRSPRPQNGIPKSIAATTNSSQSQQLLANGQNGSYASGSGFASQDSGMEARAGDDIDRILDQMGDSDSDDERPSNHRTQGHTGWKRDV